MQFKYPELLWALFLLLIPIIIHLFQLRRFKKTPFTNVKLLQKVVAESRRSSALKKWLLLLSRLLVILGLVFAFAQPFFANSTALSEKETVVYLDNSFSMQARKNEQTLLEAAIQELIEVIPKESTFSLFTNDRIFKDVTLKAIQNDLLELDYSDKQLQLDEIELSALNLFGSDTTKIRNCIIISDFQQRIIAERPETEIAFRKHFIQLRPDSPTNIVLDTAYITQTTANNLELTTEITASGSVESIPVSLYDDEKLIAKTAAVFDQSNTSTVQFTLPQNGIVNGKIEISDAALSYDNQLFFNLNQKEKIKVLSVGEGDASYLSRIYSDDEFFFEHTSLSSLNFSLLEKQNLIILNEIPVLNNALVNAIRSFVSDGGSVVIIPHPQIDIRSYNEFLIHFANTSYGERLVNELKVTGIAFKHPLYRNVFEKEVVNFQYPTVAEYYLLKSRASKVLTYQDNSAFLVATEGLYLFTSSLEMEYSNFKNSPLIVPTFYAMATNSLKLPELYYNIGQLNQVDIPMAIDQDNILKVAKADYEFIPQQQYYPSKTALIFRDNPKEDGIYQVSFGDQLIQNISFNTNRNESELVYANTANFKAESRANSITSLFEQIEKDNRVTELWKWFVILALLFMIAEIIIQKVFK